MSSRGAASTAAPGRVSSVMATTSTEYKVILPQLPKGQNALNTVILHGDPSARPYRIEDFGDALKGVLNMEEIAGLGPLQFNHVWMVTLHSAESRDVLAARSELVVKGKRCLVIDPSVRELTVKVHWVPIPTPDEVVKELLTPFGRVKHVEREMWRREGFGNLETTTRNVTMILGDGVGPDKLPHQGNIDGTKVLFSVPGRPPLCLRCERVGHMRRQCVAPWCRVCRGFGHEPEQCTRSYADMTRGVRRPEHFGEQLDNADMEELETHAVSLPNIVENVDDQPCGASEGDKVTNVEAAAAAAGEATASPAPVAIEPEETGEATNPSIPPAFVDGEPECVAEHTSAKDSEGWQPAPTKRKNNKKKATQASEEERANKMKLRGKKNEDPSPPDGAPSPTEDPLPIFP